MPLPPAYVTWQAHARRLLDPLVALREPGRAQLRLGEVASAHDAQADRLEAFARPGLLAALYLCSAPTGDAADEAYRADWAAWLRTALLQGTDPTHPDYWGPNTNYHQSGVEIGLYVLALHVAREQLWDPLSEADQAQIIRWVASNRGTGHHWNNHLYFGVFALEFLIAVGAASPMDERVIDVWMDEMETMARADGWFMDGMNQSYDHYNAYAFHFYGPLWARYFGDRTPERRARAERWLAWSRAFLPSYAGFFAASGEHPAFGRSITYRFNAAAPFATAALAGCNPLDPGMTRELCTRNLEFFLSKDIYTADGGLNIGWHDDFPGVAEPYSCSGSVYWAAKAFICLLIPPTDPFWTAPAQPLPAELNTRPTLVRAGNLAARPVEGEVELLNAGSEITPVNKDKFGPWKWGKLHYRTGVGFCVGQGLDAYSRDAGITARDPKTGRVFGRHFTVPVRLANDGLACIYTLGDTFEQFNLTLETELWWHGSWLLHLHHFTAYDDCELALGGYALAKRDPGQLQSAATGTCTAIANDGERQSVVAVLHASRPCVSGYDARLEDSIPRSHVQAPYHLTPLVTIPVRAGESGWLVAVTGLAPMGVGNIPNTVEVTSGGQVDVTLTDGSSMTFAAPSVAETLQTEKAS